MSPNTSGIFDDHSPEAVTNSENELLVRRSSSMKMDADFDIDKFNGVEQESTTIRESGVQTDISDEDFLKQFPSIDINPTPKLKVGLSKSHQKSILEYAMPTPSPSIENYSDYSVTPSTSKGNKRKTKAPKRRLNDILVYDDDLENQCPKKSKIVKCLNDTMDFDSGEYVSNESILQSMSGSARSLLAEKTDNNCTMDHEFLKDACSEEYENNSDNEEMEPNDSTLEDYDFPNLAEDINFDVSAISNRRFANSYRGNMGDKRMQDYLRERYLTAECIEQLHSSLMKIPKDAIERDPRGLDTQLMPHQRHALKWMRWREEQKPSGGILADDMGLGKTVQMISLVLAANNDKKDKAAAEGNANVDCDDDFDDDWGTSDSNSREIFEGKTLVVCPASVMKQWEREVRTKTKRGQLSVFVYHGTSRDLSTKKLSKYDIVITTYHLIAQEYSCHIAPTRNKNSKIFRIKWERVILDEAHYIRNFKSKGSIAVCELSAKSKWALTGTPIQNKQLDLYALLKFLKCSPFDEIQVWRRWVSNKNKAGNQRLIVITKTLMLRRTKIELMAKGVIQQLPEKKMDLIEIDLDSEEKIVYQKLLLYSQTFFNEFLRQRKDKEHLKEFGCHMRPSLIHQEVPDKLSKLLKVLMKHHMQIETHYILVLILRLRQMCCHPALIKSMLDKEDIDLEGEGLQNQQLNADMMEELNKFMSDDEDDDDDDDYGIDEKAAKNIMTKTNPIFKNDRQGSKVRAVLATVQSILDKGEKVIVVSQWTGFLQVIANNLDYMPDAKYDVFSGKVAVKDRQDIVDKLNDNDDKLNVLLLSLTAGGVGLNLVGANNLILIDLHWNPQLETQAQDRIYRFGQEHNVHIYKFICKDTIEEKIKALQDMKLLIAKDVLTGTVSNKLTIEDLKLLFS